MCMRTILQEMDCSSICALKASAQTHLCGMIGADRSPAAAQSVRGQALLTITDRWPRQNNPMKERQNTALRHAVWNLTSKAAVD